MTTDLALALCPRCGGFQPTCMIVPLDAALRTSAHEVFCAVAFRMMPCAACCAWLGIVPD